MCYHGDGYQVVIEVCPIHNTQVKYAHNACETYGKIVLQWQTESWKSDIHGGAPSLLT